MGVIRCRIAIGVWINQKTRGEPVVFSPSSTVSAFAARLTSCSLSLCVSVITLTGLWLDFCGRLHTTSHPDNLLELCFTLGHFTSSLCFPNPQPPSEPRFERNPNLYLFLRPHASMPCNSTHSTPTSFLLYTYISCSLSHGIQRT
jgi:hypothetical protein